MRRDGQDDGAPGPAATGRNVPFYTIGQVASLLEVPTAQLRRLDEQEIVQPERSDGNQRRYSQEEIDRLREVLQLTDEGVTLPGVRKVLELRRRVDELEHELERERGEA
ncbi:MerR family transcriptional regulator [Georgenia deserti]|uniref:MerR family transcriptional regulator n=1 Tax=Georgenia deserti TaxID=2093781 RepID=A0ABW4L3L6_9MICO